VIEDSISGRGGVCQGGLTAEPALGFFGPSIRPRSMHRGEKHPDRASWSAA
jgi:hypothetical protein